MKIFKGLFLYLLLILSGCGEQKVYQPNEYNIKQEDYKINKYLPPNAKIKMDLGNDWYLVIIEKQEYLMKRNCVSHGFSVITFDKVSK